MTEKSYLDQLNEAQRAAVEYISGPQLVIAGAGSGKTRVLTYKIVHLLNNGHRARNILALTFTNKAAREMRERIEGLTAPEVSSQLWMGTFHSIFAKILRIHAAKLGFNSNFTIYDTSDSKSLIKTIIKELKLDDKVYKPGVVMSDISNAKNNLYSAQAYAADRDIRESDKAAGRPRTAEIYKLYTERCKLSSAMDFDDLLFYTNVLLRDFPEVRQYYQDYFSYILVDEYQDTNFAQHMIVRQLCGAHNRLCVVGDDAQSIYSFRGANIRNILDLRKSFNELRTFKLEENYRSTKNIIGAANTLIAANKEQIPKEVFSNKSEGERIEVVRAYSDYEEAYIVANRLAQVRMRTHLPLNEIAVLFRTNAQSRVLEEALRSRNIPYRMLSGMAFYQRKEVKDAVCYFRMAVNPHDDEALRRVINTPKRGIGDTTVNKLTAAAVNAGVSIMSVLQDPERYLLQVNKGTMAKLNGFTDLIESFQKMNEKGMEPDKLAQKIISETGLLKEYTTDSTPENISKQENVMELLKAVGQYTEQALEEGGEEAPSMAGFLAEVSLLTDQDKEEEADVDSVSLMTIHSAKGLEFGAVFLVGAEEELLPSSLSMKNPSEIEEERRLMYVAITRAKQFCMISYAKQRVVNGQTLQRIPSRFIADINPRYLRPLSGTTLEKPRPSRLTNGFAAPAPAPQTSTTPQTFNIRQAANPEVPKAAAKAPTAGNGFSTHSAAELRQGTRINHATFGLGVVQAIDTSGVDDRIRVEFAADGQTRTLLLKFARFTILS